MRIYIVVGLEIRFFCLTDHFWCWCKSVHVLQLKGFGSSESPLFCPAFTGNFPNFSYKEVHDSQKIKLFTLTYFIQYFLLNTVMHYHLVLVQADFFVVNATFHGVIQCHHTRILYKIWSLWFIVFWCCSKFDIVSHLLTFSQTFRIVHLWNCSCNKRM